VEKFPAARLGLSVGETDILDVKHAAYRNRMGYLFIDTHV
jgi:hypothetical protein